MEESHILRLLYRSAFGRMLLRPLVSAPVTKVAGWYMDRRLSTIHIRGFIRRNHIDMADFEVEDPRSYPSFNAFFTRTVKVGRRPVDHSPDALIAPCDARLSAYRIDEGARFAIKESTYSISELLGGDPAATSFVGGTCLVFRLCVDDYHRYCYIDDGCKGKNIHLDGVFHTVRPIALGRYPVFVQNSREYTLMETAHLGTVIQIEVGALMVGRIANHQGEGTFKRGEEKGLFLYGGSTIVVLLRRGAATIPQELFDGSARGEEEPVRYGQRIGTVG